jgi:hypothetical protein
MIGWLIFAAWIAGCITIARLADKDFTDKL